jgi:hypothetical protein
MDPSELSQSYSFNSASNQQPPDSQESVITKAKRFRLIIVLLGLVILFISGILLQRYYLDWKISQYQISQQKVNNDSKKQTDQEYQNLIEKQKKENQNRSTIVSSDKTLSALGKQKLTVIFVKPTQLSESTITPIINKLKTEESNIFSDCGSDSSCPANTSLRYINTYLKEQAQKYQVNDLSLEIDFKGPYSLTSLEKVGDMAYLWGKDIVGTVKLRDGFDKLLKENNIGLAPDNLVVFLYFDNSYSETTKDADPRFYEHKTFRSFANPETKTAYINVYNFNPLFSKTVTSVVAHEILHLFGATDKYEENITNPRACSIRGRGEIDKNPPLPQTTGDIMCLYIEESETKFKRGSLTEKNLVINKFTAEEIGWTKSN